MFALINRSRRERGFTLVELLIVVLIVGILAAIAIPVYLGIQAQAHKSATKADVNNRVKQVQVTLVEGGAVSSLYGTTAGADRGSTVQVKASTNPAAGTNDFMVVGIQSRSANPGASLNYSYVYDSVTGQFSEYDNDQGGVTDPSVSITTASLQAGASGTAYNQTIAITTANTTSTTQFGATGLPAGLGINQTTGVISGTPMTGGTFSVVVTVTNGTATATKTYTLTLTGQIVTTFNFNTLTSLPAGWTTGGPGNVVVSGGALVLTTYTSSSKTVSYTFNTPNGGSFQVNDRSSSELGYDYGRVTVDGNQVSSKSGNGSTSISALSLAAGQHTMVISYSKDGSVDSYNDSYYIYSVIISANQ